MISLQGSSKLRAAPIRATLVARLALVMLLGAGTLSSAGLAFAGSAVKTAADKLDINTATADQRKTVPGIDDAHAQKIIAGRPYRSKLDPVHKEDQSAIDL